MSDEELEKLFERVYAYKIASLVFNADLLREQLRELVDNFQSTAELTSGGTAGLLDLALRALEPGTLQKIASTFGEMKKFEPLERKLVPGVIMGPTLADIAGFYAAFGLKNSEELPLDHLSVEAEFMAHLVLREIYAKLHGNSEMLDIVIDAERKFLRDHFSRTATYIAALKNLESPELRELADALENFINEEMRRFGLPALSQSLKLEEGPSDEVRCPYA